MLSESGASEQAIPILREAVDLCEALVEKAGGQSCEELLTSPDHVKATVQLGNLSATMGDLANALRHAGYHHEALIVSEKSLSIAERVGDQYAASAGHHRCASILMDAGLLHEADTRFEVAVAVARQTGNKGLEGLTLQRQSGLAIHRNQLERASGLCQRALQLFRQAGNQGEIMPRQIYESLDLKEVWKDYNTLSEIAQARGDLAAAAEWAKKRDDLLAVLEHRAGGGGGLLSGEMLKALQALTLTCAQTGFGDGGLGPDVEEALAQLDKGPAPFPDFAGFLRQIAAGQLTAIPGGLPEELRGWLEELVEAIRKGS